MSNDRGRARKRRGKLMVVGLLAACWGASPAGAQNGAGAGNKGGQPEDSYQQTTGDYNRRLAEINRILSQASAGNPAGDYRIGPDDQLEISVLEAAELDRAPRVSAGGEISLALVGTVRAAGLTAQELEVVIEELLRRNYINDPHVSVQVREMQSHPVAVFGAVKKPGVFQIRGPKTVVELLSMAEGLDVDAGDSVIIEHRGESRPPQTATSADPDPAAGLTSSQGSIHIPLQEAAQSETRVAAAQPGVEPSTEQVDLKKLLATGDPRLNVMVYPGDVVKVPRAELVYVVGEVSRPGGFELKSNENISVMQAIALAQGLTHTSSSSKTRIIRTDAATGQRQQIPINLNKVLSGQIADPILEPRDIVFVPNSVSRTAIYRSVDAALTIGSGVAIYRW